MKRSLLFIGYDSSFELEIKEYFHDKASEVYFADSHENAIRTIEHHKVDEVILNFHGLSDVVILRYINRYHPNIEIVLSAYEEIEELIYIFNQKNYSRLPKHFSLEMLNKAL